MLNKTAWMTFLLMTACRKMAALTLSRGITTTKTIWSRAGLLPTIRSPPGSVRHRNVLFMSTIADDMETILQKINDKGEQIRQLKAAGINKEDLGPHIEELKALKSQLPTEPSSPPSPSPPSKEKTSSKSKAPVTEKVVDESELRQARLDKVTAMKLAGVEPYQYSYNPTMTAAQLATEYMDKLEPGEEDAETDVAVAGRIMTRRVFGKLAFFTLQDETGIVQLQLDKTRLGDSFEVSH